MPYEESISIYLHDHLAGATAGVDIVEQAVDRHGCDELGGFIAPLAAEIKADHAVLEALIEGMTGAQPAGGAPAPIAAAAIALDIDLPGLAGAFSHRLRDADLPVTVAQTELYARSLQLMEPGSRQELYFATRAIFVTDIDDVATFDRVFAEVFGGDVAPATPQPPVTGATQDDLRAMNAQRQIYRRRGWQARGASTWVEGDSDRRGSPRAAEGSDNSHLSDIFMLETLSAGIEGKLSMWKALHNVADVHPALAAIDFEALEARAEIQRARVEEMIREIAPQALTHELVGV